jgi:hypothetical protein
VRPHGWQTDIGQWSDEYGSCVRIFDTRLAVFGVALDDFYAAVVNDDVTNDGDARFAAHLANAVYSTTGRGSRISKDHPDSPRKIDLGVCAAGALSRARFHAGANSREYVLDTREFYAERAGLTLQTTVVSSGLPEPAAGRRSETIGTA